MSIPSRSLFEKSPLLKLQKTHDLVSSNNLILSLRSPSNKLFLIGIIIFPLSIKKFFIEGFLSITLSRGSFMVKLIIRERTIIFII